jgi:CheY-like chemotaxis protein
MPNHKEKWNKNHSPDLGLKPAETDMRAAATNLHRNERSEEDKVPHFGYRVLVVDDDAAIRTVMEALLERRGYTVISAADGLEGLQALRKSLPDAVISDLNMPRMSGFEFLGIVRKRFPQIATIAMTGEYVAKDDSSRILADAFFEKGNPPTELSNELANLLSASPMRRGIEKSDLAPLFVPRDRTGHLIITCPKCLRPNEVEGTGLNGGIHQTDCETCGTEVKFEINHQTPRVN